MAIFIRHAESEANAGIKTSDPELIVLTEKGRAQAVDLAEKTQLNPNLIVITTYIRTKQTAEPFIKKFPNIPVEIWPLHEFTFLSPSSCKDTTAQQRVPMVQKYWEKCDPDYVHGQGAESFNQFVTRIYSCFQKMKQIKTSNVTVFTHSHVMRLIKQLAAKQKMDMLHYRCEMLRSHFPNLSFFETTD